jgi:hypothetical protein
MNTRTHIYTSIHTIFYSLWRSRNTPKTERTKEKDRERKIKRKGLTFPGALEVLPRGCGAPEALEGTGELIRGLNIMT